MISIQSEEELQEEIERHANEPVLVFKHSTTCPVSAEAYRQIEQFATNSTTPILYIRVIEDRPVSNYVASTYGIKHESPQALLLKNNEVQWHASHWNITKNSLAKAVTAASNS